VGDDPFAVRLTWPADDLPDAGPADVPPPVPDGAAADGAHAGEPAAALRALAASVDALGRGAANGQAALAGRLADLAAAVRDVTASTADGLEEVREHVASFGDELRALAAEAAALAGRLGALEDAVAAVGALVPLVEELVGEVRALRRRLAVSAPTRR
jgi:ABC-type transporter Mla subunit MlaD